MNFEEWYKSFSGFEYERNAMLISAAEQAWLYQQSKLDIAIKALEFYADGGKIATESLKEMEKIK